MAVTTSEARALRATIAILAIAGFASTFAARIVDPLVNVIADDLGASIQTIALLATAFTLPYALIQPVLGPFGDSLGKLKVMRYCLVVMTLALVASAFMPGERSLFVMRVITGMAAGGIIPMALAIIGDRVSMETRQVAISRFLAAMILGQMAGSSLSGILADLIGWRGVFHLAALVSAIAFVSMIVVLKPSHVTRPPFSLSVAMQRYQGLLANPRARALFALVFVEGICIMGVLPFIAPILVAREAGGAPEAGIALAGFAIGGLIYSAFVALLLRRLGMYRMLVSGGFCAAMALIGIAFLGDWRLIAGALLLLGLGFYLLHNSFQTQVTELAPEARSSAVALHAFAFFMGNATGPVVFSIASRIIGAPATLVTLACVIFALGLFAAWVLARTAPKPLEA